MSRCRIRASTPMPSRSGITRSRMARLIGGRSLASRRANAPSPYLAVSTSYPNRLAIASSRRRWMGSSSTTSIRAVIVVPKPALGTAHAPTLCHHGKRIVNAASFRPAVYPKAPLCRRVAIAETLARARIKGIVDALAAPFPRRRAGGLARVDGSRAVAAIGGSRICTRAWIRRASPPISSAPSAKPRSSPRRSLGKLAGTFSTRRTGASRKRRERSPPIRGPFEDLLGRIMSYAGLCSIPVTLPIRYGPSLTGDAQEKVTAASSSISCSSPSN